MRKKAVVVLAEGFEEIEAVTPADILRRAGVDVTIAGLDSISVKSTRGITINADIMLAGIDFVPDALIFPGGLPGAENLAGSSEVMDLIKKVYSEGKLVAAICASPAFVLVPSGVLEGRKATGYPGTEDKFPKSVRITAGDVVQDANVITSRGPGTAAVFAFAIAKNLVGEKKAQEVARDMLFS